MGTTISGGFYLDKNGNAHDANGLPIGASKEDAPAAPVINLSATAIFNETAKVLHSEKTGKKK